MTAPTFTGSPVTPELANRHSDPAAILAAAHSTFTPWLGDDYDTDALDAVLATAACEKLTGDPVWLLLLSGSGNAKTETVQSLAAVGATIVSTISSTGALLSATSKRETTAGATGGLLCEMGPRGIIVIKDVTSIPSMNANTRGEVLAALREIYDGSWTRHVGTDGGRALSWAGRLVTIGAVTTAWDRAHDVISSMGDRFVIVRMDSYIGRQNAGRQAIGNTGREVAMRDELGAVVAEVLEHVGRLPAIDLTAEETDRLLAAADVVTLARTGVDFDYQGNVIDSHAPEMPARFAKQLAQIVRGAVAIGIDRAAAVELAIRCAPDSMPPMRLAILDDVAEHPDSATKEVRKRLGTPRTTVDRQLQALTQLGVLDVDEQKNTYSGRASTVWRYRVGEGIDPGALALKKCPEMLRGPQPLVRVLIHLAPLVTSLDTLTRRANLPPLCRAGHAANRCTGSRLRQASARRAPSRWPHDRREWAQKASNSHSIV